MLHHSCNRTHMVHSFIRTEPFLDPCVKEIWETKSGQNPPDPGDLTSCICTFSLTVLIIHSNKASEGSHLGQGLLLLNMYT